MTLDDALKCADDPESNSGVEVTLAAGVRRLTAENAELRGRVLELLDGVFGDTVTGDKCLREARAILQSEQPK